MFFHLINRKIK